MKSFAEEFHRIHGKARPILGTCVYGLASSMAAVGFQLAINRLYLFLFKAPADPRFQKILAGPEPKTIH